MRESESKKDKRISELEMLLDHERHDNEMLISRLRQKLNEFEHTEEDRSVTAENMVKESMKLQRELKEEAVQLALAYDQMRQSKYVNDESRKLWVKMTATIKARNKTEGNFPTNVSRMFRNQIENNADTFSEHIWDL